MNLVLRVIFLISLSFVGFYGFGAHTRSNELLARLLSLRNNPQVAEALGPDARVIEAVNFDLGIMIRYYQSQQICLGKLVVMPTGNSVFEPDGRCLAPKSSSFNVTGRNSAPPVQAYDDLAEFSRAVTFAERVYVKSQGRGIREILGARRDNALIVLTYRTRGTDEICQLTLKPAIADYPNYAWRINPTPACEVQ